MISGRCDMLDGAGPAPLSPFGAVLALLALCPRAAPAPLCPLCFTPPGAAQGKAQGRPSLATHFSPSPSPSSGRATRGRAAPPRSCAEFMGRLF